MGKPLTIDQVDIVGYSPSVGGRGLFVLVNAIGPRGGVYEYTISYDHRDRLSYAIQTVPAYVDYGSKAEGLPSEVLMAAAAKVAEYRR